MLFSPIDSLWVGLIVLVLFVLIYGLCYCLKLCVEPVKTGQKILTEQQESMSKRRRAYKEKGKRKETQCYQVDRKDKIKEPRRRRKAN
ncbi:mCG1034281 [Mus musculus]|nr:mCG1034281 [Mus musculus]